MSLTPVLEIIISLAALYWLLSMGCSFFVEALNSLVLNVRAKALERFVCEMVLGTGKVPQLLTWRRGLDFFRRSTLDATKKGGKAASNSDAGSLADPLGLFSHGLVKSLRKPHFLSTGGATPPSYIPSRAFAQALLDRLKMLGWCTDPMPNAEMAGILTALTTPRPALAPLHPSAVTALGTLVPGTSSLLDLATVLLRSLNTMAVSDACTELRRLIQLLAPTAPAVLSGTPLHLHNIAQAALDALEQLPQRTQHGTRPLQEVIGTDALWMLAVRIAGREVQVDTVVLDAVKHLLQVAPLPTALKEALRPILADAHFDADKLLKGIETWYEAVMDRASGWFKRNATVMLGVFGLVAACSLNINTLQVIRDLKNDPGLRLAGVAAAEGIYHAGGRPVMAQQLAFLELHKGGVWRKTAVAAEQAASAAASGNLDVYDDHDTLRRAVASKATPAILQQVDVDGVRFYSMRDAMRLRLLTSGAMVAAAVQAQAWSRSHDAPGDTAYLAARDRLREALCSGSTETDMLASKDVNANANTQMPIASRLQSWPACAWIGKILPAKSEKPDKPNTVDGRATELLGLWQAPELVWHAGLAKALFALDQQYKLATPDAARLQAAWEEALQQYDLAVTVAHDNAGQAEDFLARIPSLQKQSVTFSALSSTPVPGTGWDILNELVGWFITAVMVSYGAPFWFDLISKLLGQRASVGPKPAPAD
nr:hypothetical protein [uncultured Albidiferax sp.]